jgi:hypothetical protein
MAMCEKCGKNGFVPYQMAIDPIEQKFIGPCCKDLVANVHVLQQPPAPAPIHILTPVRSTDEVEYGLEMSNKIGVRAYANYHGLQVSFERTPVQIKKWAEETGLVEAQAR